MQIIRQFSRIPAALKGAVVAIGNFDGVHIGHQALIREGQALAKKTGRPFAILTFEPHPRRVFQPSLPHIRLMRFAEKARLLQSLGIDAIFVQRFNLTFSKMMAEAFIEKILIAQLGVSHVITGAEFVFGQARKGGAALLGEYAARGAFGYTPYKPLEEGHEKISSTWIRALLSEGKCAGAAALLSRSFTISGHVMHGDQRGRQLGFPTANLALHNRFVPKFGVYVVQVIVGEKTYGGVANLGIRPMYKTKEPLLEVYLFDFSGDLYGKRIEVQLIGYLREEMKFDTEGALIDAMHQDAEHAKAGLKKP